MKKINMNSPIEFLYQIQSSKYDIEDITISPDSQIIASTDGVRVKLWNLHTGELLRELAGGGGGLCRSLAISPDGKTIAVACNEYSVAVWNLDTGEYLRTLKYSTEFVDDFTSVAFFSDNVTLIAGGQSITEMWDIRTGKNLHQPAISAGSNLALNPNGHLIGGHLNVVEMAQIPRKGPLHRIDPLPTGVRAVAISRDGLVCAAGLSNGTIKLWQWGTYAQLHTIQAHSDTIGSIAFSSDGQTLVSAGWDKSIKFWDVKTGELQGAISENLGKKVYRMALSADDRTLVTYDNQKTIKVWRLG
jgi:WD40 repeat protein